MLNPVGRSAKTSFQSANALITVLCSSFKMNALSISFITDVMAESTHLNSPVADTFVVNEFNPILC